MIGRRKAIARVSAVGWLAIIATAAAAQNTPAARSDRVWIEPPRPTKSQSDWYPRSIVQRGGKIIDFDGTQLRWVVDGDEAESVIASRRVLWIQPAAESEKEALALRLFADGKYSESIRPLLDVLAERPPVWRQQWVSMLAAYAAYRGSRGEIALELVSQLDKRSLAPLTIAWLPVAWRGRVADRTGLNATAKSAAAERLSDPSAAVRLVAASWLLSGPDRDRAVATLRSLAVDDQRAVIARLADTLLWRTATPPEVTKMADQWQKKLDALPMVLQVGPTLTLIEKLRAVGMSEEAKSLELSLKLTPPLPHPEIDSL